MATNQQKTLTARQEAGLVALVEHRTPASASRAAGIPLRTLMRWLTEPAFTAALEDARKSVFDLAIETLRAGSLKAAQTLIEKCESSSDADAIRAARAVLEMYTRATQLHELDERLKAIEQKQNAHETLNAMHRRVA